MEYLSSRENADFISSLSKFDLLFSAFLPSIINMDTLKSGLTDFKKGAVKKYKQATGTLVHAVPRYIHKRAKKGKGNERGKE